ncbi:MAG: hypothetical protein GWP05_08605 [Anaerolineaceae bacterium]|nr:hypothetical protein [Anaerolineaceae bacterium]
MATQMVMPKLSDTMTEGTVVAWLKSEGERIEAGEVLAEVQSDKATIELEAYTSGVVRKIVVAADQTVPVGELIAIIAEEDEDISAVAEGPGQPAPAAVCEEVGKPAADEKPPKAAPHVPHMSRGAARREPCGQAGPVRVKFGGRGFQTGLSRKSAEQAIAAVAGEKKNR